MMGDWLAAVSQRSCSGLKKLFLSATSDAHARQHSPAQSTRFSGTVENRVSAPYALSWRGLLTVQYCAVFIQRAIPSFIIPAWSSSNIEISGQSSAIPSPENRDTAL